MVKKYYEPYEQMYKKMNIETGEEIVETKHVVEEELEVNPMEETIAQNAEIIMPIRQEIQEEHENITEEEIHETQVDETQMHEFSKTVNEQDSAAYIVENPLHKFNIKNIFERLEIDDLIIIGLIVILLLEEGEDIPLVLVLGFLLLSDIF